MKKQQLKQIVAASGRQDVIVTSYTEKNFPCILLAEMQPLYLITFRVNLKMMPEDEVLTIGRSDVCDFQVPDVLTKVSRLHCYIEKCADGSFKVHDVSKCGTRVLKEPKDKSLLRRFFAAF